MKNRVITLSREFGSGGRTIDRKLAEKLGIPCYDAQLLKDIAEKNGFNENYIKDVGEYAPGGFISNVLSNRCLDLPMAIFCGIFIMALLPNWHKRGHV